LHDGLVAVAELPEAVAAHRADARAAPVLDRVAVVDALGPAERAVQEVARQHAAAHDRGPARLDLVERLRGGRKERAQEAVDDPDPAHSWKSGSPPGSPGKGGSPRRAPESSAVVLRSLSASTWTKLHRSLTDRLGSFLMRA